MAAASLRQLALTITVKNSSEHIAAISEILQSQGLEARRFLLRLLLKEFDINTPGAANSPSTSLLRNQISSACAEPNFISILFQAFEPLGQALSVTFLASFARCLGLGLSEQVSIALSFCLGPSPRHQSLGAEYLTTKFGEISATSIVLPSLLAHTLLEYLESNSALFSADAVAAVSRSLYNNSYSALASASSAVTAKDIVLNSPIDFYSPRPSDYPIMNVNRGPTMASFDAAAASGQLPIATVMADFGYICTASTEFLSELFSHFPRMREADVAQILGMMARTHSALPESQLHMPLAAISARVPALDRPASSWNIDNLLAVLKRATPDLRWPNVIRSLDFPGFRLNDQKGLGLIISAYRRATDEPFPIDSLFSKWKNTVGQLSFISLAISAPPDVVNFAAAGHRKVGIEGLVHRSVFNPSWTSLDLIETLLNLADEELHDAVRAIFEYPAKNCPEVLLVGIAQARPDRTTLPVEMLRLLLPVFAVQTHPNSTVVISHLWKYNPNLLLNGLIDIYMHDPSTLPRILDIAQDLKALKQFLEARPFGFAIDLGALASRREFLNLPKWLEANLKTHRNPFAQACVNFLAERVPQLTSAGRHEDKYVPLSVESAATFFKCLRSSMSLLSADIVEQTSQLLHVCSSSNPKLVELTSDSNPVEFFSKEVEEEANSYFERIYRGELTVEAAVNSLKIFKQSKVQREHEVFACMIHNLFDEYRFFPRYPERELRLTAVLFGQIIMHNLVASVTLGIALRFVLQALKKPANPRMFQFGITAMEQFKSRLSEWPQYCAHLKELPTVLAAMPELVGFLDAPPSPGITLAHVPPSEGGVFGQMHPMPSPVPPLPPMMEQTLSSMSDGPLGSRLPPPLAGLPAPQYGMMSGPSSAGRMFPPELAMSMPSSSSAASPPPLSGIVLPPVHLESASMVSASSYASASPVGPVPVSGKAPGSASSSSSSSSSTFAGSLSNETLARVASERPVLMPPEEVQGSIAFAINNVSVQNLDVKVRDISGVLQPQYTPFMAQYLVFRRVCTELNYHGVYIQLVDGLKSKPLEQQILAVTFDLIRVLLKSDKIKTSSQDRTLIKNLGSWLGAITVAKSKPLLHRDLDIKELLVTAFEQGRLIAVIPFVAKILEQCGKSRVFQPPNPWTMAMLSTLAEIYALPDLKLNLKFEVELLCKNLNVASISELPSRGLLKGRHIYARHQNADFANLPALPPGQQPPMPPPTPEKASSQAQQPVMPQAISIFGDDMSDKQQQAQAMQAGASSTGAAAGAAPMEGFAGAPHGFPVMGDQQALGALSKVASMVTINPSVLLFAQQPHLKRFVPMAIERAIAEIILPVVDRSVKIACITTRELVVKDFAMEPDENKMRKAAMLMVTNLAANLAMVTCKDPLRVSIGNHLRAMLQSNGVTDLPLIEQAVQLVAADSNLEMGCSFVEKAATDRAVRDMDEALAPSYMARRSARESGQQFFDSAGLWGGSNPAPPAGAVNPPVASLPEALRPKPGPLPAAQMRVYEDFGRPILIPRVPSAEDVKLPGGPPVPGLPSDLPAMEELSPQQALDRLVDCFDQVERELSNVPPSESDFQRLFGSISVILSACPAREDIAFSFSQRAIQRLYEVYAILQQQSLQPAAEKALRLAALVYMTILEVIRDKCPKFVTALTNFLVYNNDERKLSLPVLVNLARCHLFSIPEFDVHLANLLANPHPHPLNPALRPISFDFAVAFVRACVLDEEFLAGPELTQTLDALFKMLKRPDAPENLAKLIEDARNTTVARKATPRVSSITPPPSSTPPSSTPPSSAGRMGPPVAGVIGAAAVSRAVQPPSAAGAVAPAAAAATVEPDDPAMTAMREQVGRVFQEWCMMVERVGGADKTPSEDMIKFASQLQSLPIVQDDETSERMFRCMLEAACEAFHAAVAVAPPHLVDLASSVSASADQQQQVSALFAAIDSLSRLVALLVKPSVAEIAAAAAAASAAASAPPPAVGSSAPPQQSGFALYKASILNKVLMAFTRALQRDIDVRRTRFNQRPFYRFFTNLYFDLCVADMGLESVNFPVLSAMASALHQLQPTRVPAFAFSWLDLISHRLFMPRMLNSKMSKGWPQFQRLLVSGLRFLVPFLRSTELSNPVRMMYRALLKVLLVLLHDFPDFLCDYHFSLCDVIPPSCIQMRNLVLSSFPRHMRLPDPFTRNLKVDRLPEIQKPPRVLSDYTAALMQPIMLSSGAPASASAPSSSASRSGSGSSTPSTGGSSGSASPPAVVTFKDELDTYLKTRQPTSFLTDLKVRLLLPPHEVVARGTHYNVSLINSLVLYLGVQGTALQSNPQAQTMVNSACSDIFRHLLLDLDPEGRYLFINAIVNQLRYPNTHTHYFSWVLLGLFADVQAGGEVIQEQITRVLLERLIVNRPHPWGLLITFIELVKNQRYNFWQFSFIHCAPEIVRLFENVVRSCLSAQNNSGGGQSGEEDGAGGVGAQAEGPLYQLH